MSGRLLGATWPVITSLVTTTNLVVTGSGVVNGDLNIDGALDVDGAATLNDDLQVTGDLSGSATTNISVGGNITSDNDISCANLEVDASIAAATANVSTSLTMGVNSFIDIPESTVPAAPAANTARMYARDDGGKTELAARFPTGAAQQVAQEP